MSIPPQSVCILRLSAIGDVCHTLAVVRRMQDAWPQTRFTWIIGKLEAKLLGHLPDIEFIVFDKRAGWRAYVDLRRKTRGRRFDVLLHMQLALRASAIASMVPATIKLGFDRARARELQWLVTNRKIKPQHHQHVLDGLMGFADYFNVATSSLRWDIPLPDEALAYARKVIPDNQPTLIISPCSSHALRNWSAEHYATVADHAVGRLRMRVLICGGPSAPEREMGAAIQQHMKQTAVSLVGQDTLLQMLATLQRARVLISPDSGPAHMATCVGTPVIGLYAATRLARSGPYLSRQWSVDGYEQAALQFMHQPADRLPWAEKIEYPGVMDLIAPEAVIEKLTALMAR
jgi:heptosyltransferase I